MRIWIVGEKVPITRMLAGMNLSKTGNESVEAGDESIEAGEKTQQSCYNESPNKICPFLSRKNTNIGHFTEVPLC